MSFDYKVCAVSGGGDLRPGQSAPRRGRRRQGKGPRLHIPLQVDRGEAVSWYIISLY